MYRSRLRPFTLGPSATASILSYITAEEAKMPVGGADVRMRMCRRKSVNDTVTGH